MAKFDVDQIVRVIDHPKPEFIGINGAVTDIICLNFGRPRVFYDIRPIYPSLADILHRIPEDFLEAV